MPDDRFNEYCEGLLASYKRRNTKAVTQRLESLCVNSSDRKAPWCRPCSAVRCGRELT